MPGLAIGLLAPPPRAPALGAGRGRPRSSAPSPSPSRRSTPPACRAPARTPPTPARAPRCRSRARSSCPPSAASARSRRHPAPPPGYAAAPLPRFFSTILRASSSSSGMSDSSTPACIACAAISSSGRRRLKYGSAASRCTSGSELGLVGLHARTSCVRYRPEATRSAPITNACSPADGVDRMSRSTPPTGPEAIITVIARPSYWSLPPTTMPSMSIDREPGVTQRKLRRLELQFLERLPLA